MTVRFTQQFVNVSNWYIMPVGCFGMSNDLKISCWAIGVVLVWNSHWFQSLFPIIRENDYFPFVNSFKLTGNDTQLKSYKFSKLLKSFDLEWFPDPWTCYAERAAHLKHWLSLFLMFEVHFFFSISRGVWIQQLPLNGRNVPILMSLPVTFESCQPDP